MDFSGKFILRISGAAVYIAHEGPHEGPYVGPGGSGRRPYEYAVVVDVFRKVPDF